MPIRLSHAALAMIVASLAVPAVAQEIAWHDIKPLGVEGRGFEKTKVFFDRLPASAEKLVRPAVWTLSRHSAGQCVRFVSDATTLFARWTLRNARLAMPHMPATGVSGVDLYVRTDTGRWRWLACGRPTKFPTNSVRLVTGIPEGRREYLLYLPLYNGVTSVEVGVAAAAELVPAPARPASHRKPILFYGTSITHGACASRPGMTHVAILGRRFQRPVINLGFSGNGRMEPELAELLAQLDPAVYVLDCLPNMNAAMVAERAEPFVLRLRQSRPKTPIMLVEDRSYADAFLVTAKRERNRGSRRALKVVWKNLKRARVKKLYYLEGAKLLGDDGEATVDSSHPTDLGFVRQAEKFAKVLRKILGKPRE